MRLPEQKVWDWMRAKLSPIAFMHRVENRVASGTPDVYFSHLGMCGWVELKAMEKWPAAGKPVRIGNWTAVQRNWALSHRKYGGGRTWLVIGIGQEMVVADGAVWAALNADPTEEEIRQVWPVLARGCSTREVIEALRRTW